MDNNLYAARLKAFRRSLPTKMTQSEMSERLDISVEHYTNIENGYKNPSMLLHTEICLELNRPSDSFLKEDRNDFALTKEQISLLGTLKTNELKILVNLLRMVYDQQKIK